MCKFKFLCSLYHLYSSIICRLDYLYLEGVAEVLEVVQGLHDTMARDKDPGQDHNMLAQFVSAHPDTPLWSWV